MDFEAILHDLKPIIDPVSIGNFKYDAVGVNKVVETLEKCSQGARIEANRDIIGASGLLKSLRDTLLVLLGDIFDNEGLPYADEKILISSEIIRILANSFADNDKNRSIFLHTNNNNMALLDKYFGYIFSSDVEKNSVFIDLQLRLAAMSKNLIADNENYINSIGKPLVPICVQRLQTIDIVDAKQQQLALFTAELIDSVVEFNKDILSLALIYELIQFTYKISSYINTDSIDIDEADDEEPLIELISSTTGIIESSLEINGRINYKKAEELKHKTQSTLLQVLDHLAELKFHNKLIIMRRLVTSVGYVASDSTNDNTKELELSIDLIKSGNKFPYSNAAVLMILSNYINSAERAKSVESLVSIDHLVKKAKNMSDPVQFQGFLDLLKKLASMSNMMLISDQTIDDIISILSYCNDQAQYFQGLIPLINNLLNKLLTTIPATKVQKIYSGPNSDAVLNLTIKNGSITSCLALDKLLIGKNSGKSEMEEKLWDTALQFDQALKENNSNQISATVFVLFQLTKTIGVYLRNSSINQEDNFLIPKYTEKLIYILQLILQLKEECAKNIDSAANNGRFVAGMLINCFNSKSNLSEEEISLQHLCKKFF
ncbi:GTPase-GDP dissociation stimulator BEM4 [Nakaseomyces bracarensis]|uniref:GTPase-GDP dissociation stimulator BEM4 n=1 Tax=Nakaseomyces bracarensis TaxID=273131 RepID=A0ABR4NTZ5_9SACH